MGKPWYKKWWGILAIVLFLWPFFLTYWIWKRDWHLIIKVGLIAVFWLFGFAIYASSGTGQQSFQDSYQAKLKADLAVKQSPAPAVATQTPIPTSSPSPTPTPTPKPTVQLTPKQTKQEIIKNTETPKSISIMDKLWQVLDKVLQDRKSKDISYNPSSKTVILTYGDKDSMFLNESAIVEGLFAVFVQYGKEVFQIDGVNKLEITVRTIFTDSYGKENLEDAVTMDMYKEEFQKYDWNTLRFQPIYYQMERSASALYINPAILSKINLDKLKLKY